MPLLVNVPALLVILYLLVELPIDADTLLLKVPALVTLPLTVLVLVKLFANSLSTAALTIPLLVKVPWLVSFAWVMLPELLPPLTVKFPCPEMSFVELFVKEPTERFPLLSILLLFVRVPVTLITFVSLFVIVPLFSNAPAEIFELLVTVPFALLVSLVSIVNVLLIISEI